MLDFFMYVFVCKRAGKVWKKTLQTDNLWKDRTVTGVRTVAG